MLCHSCMLAAVWSFRVKVLLRRQSVGQSVLVLDYNQGPWPIFLSPWNCPYTVADLIFVAPSLTRGLLCKLLLLVLASTTPQDRTLLSQPEGSGPRIYIPWDRVAQLYPRALVSPFRRLLRLAGLRWKYSDPHTQGLLGTARAAPFNETVYCHSPSTTQQFK
jgi:hypothetical protein